MKIVGKIIAGVLIFYTIITGLFTIITGVNYIAKPFQIIMGKNANDIDRKVFESGTAHVESVARDLAKQKKELAETKDEVSRKAIINYINESYANFDASNLEDSNLRQFLKDIRNGNIK